MRVTLDPPWLAADLGRDHRVLSWAVLRPGLVTARRILWREVRNADLPVGFDAVAWLRAEVAARGAGDAVAMLTSRDIRAHHHARVAVEGVAAECLATVGLSNAERVGHRQDPAGRDLGEAGEPGWGTINIAVQVDAGAGQGLSFPALVEAATIAAQARTLAVIEAGMLLPQGPATGTGTDCIALAAPPGDIAYAGLHTALGEAVGRAVHRAVGAGAAEWARWRAAQRAYTGR